MNYTPFTVHKTSITKNNIEAKNDPVSTEHYLFLDSLYRTYGSNVDYISLFNGTIEDDNSNKSIAHGDFKNVSSVELRGVSIPHITNYPYVILDVKELNGRINSNVPIADQSFAIIYFDRVDTNSYTKPIRGGDMDTKAVYFNPPLSSLNRLSVKFLTPDGLDLNQEDFRNTLLFKIVTITK